MTDTLTTLSDQAKEFHDKGLLLRAVPWLHFYRFGQRRNIPKRGGNTVSYRRFDSLLAATTALTEGVTPTAASLATTEVTGTVLQYGNYVQVSDKLDMLGIDPVIMEATDVIGENAGETVDTLVRNVVQAGTTVIYATGSARTSQATTNVLTYDLVRKAVRNLEINNARPFHGERGDNGMGGVFIGIIHPAAWYDLKGDAQIDGVFQYKESDMMFKNSLPMLYGVAWHVTTLAPEFVDGGSASADVFGTIILGREAYGVVDVAGTGKFETIAKQLGSAGSADPLNQRATVGWKSLQLPLILNENYMVRIETGATDQA